MVHSSDGQPVDCRNISLCRVMVSLVCRSPSYKPPLLIRSRDVSATVQNSLWALKAPPNKPIDVRLKLIIINAPPPWPVGFTGYWTGRLHISGHRLWSRAVRCHIWCKSVHVELLCKWGKYNENYYLFIYLFIYLWFIILFPKYLWCRS